MFKNKSLIIAALVVIVMGAISLFISPPVLLMAIILYDSSVPTGLPKYKSEIAPITITTKAAIIKDVNRELYNIKFIQFFFL